MQLLVEEPVRYCYQYLDLQEVGWEVKDWIDLAQDRDRWGGTCKCGNEPLGSIKCGEFLD
jgi:hypothetical protein